MQVAEQLLYVEVGPPSEPLLDHVPHFVSAVLLGVPSSIGLVRSQSSAVCSQSSANRSQSSAAQLITLASIVFVRLQSSAAQLVVAERHEESPPIQPYLPYLVMTPGFDLKSPLRLTILTLLQYLDHPQILGKSFPRLLLS